MDTFLQTWGGVFYLANKVFFSLSESKPTEQKNHYKLIGWSAYLIGLPAWVILLALENNWITASISLGAIPSILLGLYQTCFKKLAHKQIEKSVQIFTYISILVGVGLSVHHFGGLVSLSQFLEIGNTVGFLMGSYLMTKHNPNGYLFFMLMNTSMATLMILQDKNILMIQQFISLCFVSYGYIQSIRNRNKLIID